MSRPYRRPYLDPIPENVLAYINDPDRMPPTCTEPRTIAHVQNAHNLNMVLLKQPDDADPHAGAHANNHLKPTSIRPFDLRDRLSTLMTSNNYYCKDTCIFIQATPAGITDYNQTDRALDLSHACIEVRHTENPHTYRRLGHIIAHAYMTIMSNISESIYQLDPSHRYARHSTDDDMTAAVYDTGCRVHNPFIDCRIRQDSPQDMDDMALAYITRVVEGAAIKLRHCVYISTDAIYISYDLLCLLAGSSNDSSHIRIINLMDPRIEEARLSKDAIFRQCIYHIDDTRDASHSTVEISSPVAMDLPRSKWVADESSIRYVNAACIDAYNCIQSIIGIDMDRLVETTRGAPLDPRTADSCLAHIVTAMVSYLSQTKAFAHAQRYVARSYQVYHRDTIARSVAFVRNALAAFINDDEIRKRPRKSLLPIA